MPTIFEVQYCSPSSFSKASYSSGSKRVTADELADWLSRETADGAVLVTSIRPIIMPALRNRSTS